MKTQQDPVAKHLDEWINRSAGQHQRRISEGTASARRLEKLPAQPEDDAALLKRWRASVIANGLHRIDTSQMPVDYAGPEPVEYDENAPLMTLFDLVAIVLIIGGFALLTYSYIR